MLSGIRILDLTRYFPGPFATLRLQERGAEIIKIEDKNGDPARFMDSINGEEGAIFRSMSRGKASVSLNLKSDEDRNSFYKLARTADAVIESFRPGVTSRLGIDYDILSAINPRLVYVSLTGYGQDSSMAHLAGHDLNYLAQAGVLDQFIDADGRPIAPQLAMADLVAGMAASEALLTGLVNVARSGKGSYQDVSMADAAISLMGLHVTHNSATGEEHGINDHGIGYGIFRTSDDRYITLCALEEKFFINFCNAVGRPHLIEYHSSSPTDDNPYYREMVEIIAEHSFDAWMDFSQKVDCCMSPIIRTSELKSNKYVVERGLLANKWGLDYVSTNYEQPEYFLNFVKPFSKLGEDNHILENGA